MPDRLSFEKKLTEGRDFSILFDVHSGFKKEITDSSHELVSSFTAARVTLYLLVNNNPPKKSTFSLYLGKTNVVTVPLTSHYKTFILNAVSRTRGQSGAVEPNKAVKRHDQ